MKNVQVTAAGRDLSCLQPQSRMRRGRSVAKWARAKVVPRNGASVCLDVAAVLLSSKIKYQLVYDLIGFFFTLKVYKYLSLSAFIKITGVPKTSCT